MTLPDDVKETTETTEAANTTAGAGGSDPAGPRLHSPDPEAAEEPAAASVGARTARHPARVALAAVLLLLLLGAGAWWYRYTNSPEQRAAAVYQAVAQRDWKTVFHLIAWEPGLDADKAAETAYIEGASSTENLPVAGMPPGFSEAARTMEVTVGQAVYDGDRADVPTVGKIKLYDRTITLHGTAHMIKQGGAWKLDMTGSSPRSLMQGVRSTTRIMSDLWGRPDVR